jgi:small conductance mechanosensitive channel
VVSHRVHIAVAVLTVVALTIAGVGLYYLATVYHVIPTSYSLLVRLGIALALGVGAVVVIQGIVRRLAQRFLGPRRASLAVSFFQLVAYLVLAAVLLLLAGVSSIAVLAGGTFAGLVLGLAAQTVLSNVIAGVMLLFVRPFNPGERVTMATWQYSLIAPAYPPKFYSNDTLVPGYTGTIGDVGIVYTAIRMDDGTRVRIPNSIVVQAALFSHEMSERWVRTKYEIPPELDPQPLIADLEKRLPENNWVVRPELLKVYLASVTLTSQVIVVDAMCRGSMEDPPRSAILLDIRAAAQSWRDAAGARNAAAAAAKASLSSSPNPTPASAGGAAKG